MSKARLRPVIFGEVLFDCFPDGSRVLGGAPFNVAWHLRGFGEAPFFISRVGKDQSGQQVRSAMTSWGMDTAGLQTDSQLPTGAVQIQLIDGEPHYTIAPDQAYDHISPDDLPTLEYPSLLYHGSLALRSHPSHNALRSLVEHYALPVFLDVNLRAPWWVNSDVTSMMKDATWLKLNSDEADVLAPSEETLTKRARHMLDRFKLKQIVVTQGSKGALAIAGSQEHFIRPETVSTVVDTVGAGDAFTSVLILGLLHNWSLPETLQRAQDFASSIVGKHGATVSEPAFYRAHLSSWGVD